MQLTSLRPALLLLALAWSAEVSRAQDQPRVPAIYALPAGGSKAWELVSLADYPYLCSPELSPDGTRVAVDGWREGENLQDAHLLIINLEEPRGPGPGQGGDAELVPRRHVDRLLEVRRRCLHPLRE